MYSDTVLCEVDVRCANQGDFGGREPGYIQESVTMRHREEDYNKN